MLRISQSAHAALRKHSEEAYPEECCGVLLGRFEADGSKTVARAQRCANVHQDSRRNRYRIDPVNVVRIWREACEKGEEVVGFYHSHPDHPAQWSTTDLAEAHWIGCSYVITSVEQGRAGATNSFQLGGDSEDSKHLVEETLDCDGLGDDTR
jgi:proteasome lid subunit RPN8/RPN11